MSEFLHPRMRLTVQCLDRLLNDPGKNQTYLDYRADIFAIKNYEKMNGNSLLGGFSARYAVDGETIRTIGI